MAKLLILNGPNLNMLGVREPEIYGSDTLEDVRTLCEDTATRLGHTIDFRQSNQEGELVSWIQEARGTFDGMIINAGAYTHTSLAIHDALKLAEMPIAEVHISNPKEREEFRHFSYIEPLAKIRIAGEGVSGYAKALEKLAEAL